jgi:hypothetical protein
MTARIAIAVVAILCLFTQAVLAAEGHQAKFTITVDFGDEFFKRVARESKQPLDKIDRGDFRLNPVNGMLYFTNERLRMDIEIGGGVGVITEIVDHPNNQILLVSHGSMQVYRISYDSLMKQYRDSGLPVNSPESLFVGWEQIEAMLRAMPKTTVTKLGQKNYAGEACHGLRFKSDLAALTKAEGISALPNQPALTDLSGPWLGEIWISDALKLPVSMRMQMLGMDYRWDLSEIKPWNVIEPLLAPPPGYRVKDIEMSELTQAISGATPE